MWRWEFRLRAARSEVDLTGWIACIYQISFIKEKFFELRKLSISNKKPEGIRQIPTNSFPTLQQALLGQSDVFRSLAVTAFSERSDGFTCDQTRPKRQLDSGNFTSARRFRPLRASWVELWTPGGLLSKGYCTIIYKCIYGCFRK